MLCSASVFPQSLRFPGCWRRLVLQPPAVDQNLADSDENQATVVPRLCGIDGNRRPLRLSSMDRFCHILPPCRTSRQPPLSTAPLFEAPFSSFVPSLWSQRVPSHCAVPSLRLLNLRLPD